ncbi:hypothetical protein MMC34_003791 [Xylographa carneopallida]|nr:hypothetical protein [Xylographa carneopallida]
MHNSRAGQRHDYAITSADWDRVKSNPDLPIAQRLTPQEHFDDPGMNVLADELGLNIPGHVTEVGHPDDEATNYLQYELRRRLPAPQKDQRERYSDRVYATGDRLEVATGWKWRQEDWTSADKDDVSSYFSIPFSASGNSSDSENSSDSDASAEPSKHEFPVFEDDRTSPSSPQSYHGTIELSGHNHARDSGHK